MIMWYIAIGFALYCFVLTFYTILRTKQHMGMTWKEFFHDMKCDYTWKEVWKDITSREFWRFFLHVVILFKDPDKYWEKNDRTKT